MARLRTAFCLAALALSLAPTCEVAAQSRFDAGPGAAARGRPVFSLALGVQRGADGAALWALATVADRSGRRLSLGEAASRMGYDHFNWLQYMIADPDLAACAGRPTFYGLDGTCAALTTIGGALPHLPTLDPPPGGWRYANGGRFPTADYLPFYWDEYFDGSGAASPDAPEYTQYQTTLTGLPFDAASLDRLAASSLAAATGFLFTDQPSQSHVGTTIFVDALVGVRAPRCDALTPGAICPAELVAGTGFAWSYDGEGRIRAQPISLEQFLGFSHATPRSLAALGIAVPPTRR